MKNVFLIFLAAVIGWFLWYVIFDPAPFGQYSQNYIHNVSIVTPDGRTMTNEVVDNYYINFYQPTSQLGMHVAYTVEAVPFDLGDGRFLFVTPRYDGHMRGPLPPSPMGKGGDLVHSFDWALPAEGRLQMAISDDISNPESFRWVLPSDGFEGHEFRYVSTDDPVTSKVVSLMPWLPEYQKSIPPSSSDRTEAQKVLLGLYFRGK